MYVIGQIKEGFGNKLFMLLRYIMEFREIHKSNKEVNQLYIVQTVSKHDEGLQSEKFEYIFPKLKEVSWLEFISWKKYDELKKDAFEILNVDFCFKKDDFFVLKSFVKKYLEMSPRYNHLLEKYDTKKGIAVHIRLGDKFNINYAQLGRRKPEKYLLMSPQYFIDETNTLLSEKKGPVYIFSDSPEFAECLIKPSLPDAIIVDEKFVETFFLLTKFKRAVLSESTLGLAAGYMNFLKHQFIIPKYRVHLSNGKIYDSPYVDSSVFQLEEDTSYKLDPSEYKEIYKTCYLRNVKK
jgi:hypothetical protein